MLGEEELLEHEPDPGRAQRRQLAVRQARHVQARDLHRAGGGPVQAAHHVQQRGLARPRRAHHRHQLPRGHGQAHLPQRGHRRHAGVGLATPARPPAPRHARAGHRRQVTGRGCAAVIRRAPRLAARPPARPRTPAPCPPRRRTTPASPAPGGACRRRRRPPPRTRRRRRASSAVTGTASTSCTVRSVIVHLHQGLIQAAGGPRMRWAGCAPAPSARCRAARSARARSCSTGRWRPCPPR